MRKNQAVQEAGTWEAGQEADRDREKDFVRQEPLAAYFPNIRTRKEVLEIIRSRKDLSSIFYQWNQEKQEFFLDCCTGAKGMKVLYDGIFKEVFNPETRPDRLEELLSLLVQRKVKIKQVLPNDSVRLGAETSLLYTDIIVQLEDGSLANVEMQKIGYVFPGERAACYSADHLMRQYKRIRSRQGKNSIIGISKMSIPSCFSNTPPKNFINFPRNGFTGSASSQIPGCPWSFCRNTASFLLTFSKKPWKIKVSQMNWKHGFPFCVMMIPGGLKN